MDMIKILVVVCTMSTSPIECQTYEGMKELKGVESKVACKQTYDAWKRYIKENNTKMAQFQCFPIQGTF